MKSTFSFGHEPSIPFEHISFKFKSKECFENIHLIVGIPKMATTKNNALITKGNHKNQSRTNIVDETKHLCVCFFFSSFLNERKLHFEPVVTMVLFYSSLHTNTEEFKVFFGFFFLFFCEWNSIFIEWQTRADGNVWGKWTIHCVFCKKKKNRKKMQIVQQI